MVAMSSYTARDVVEELMVVGKGYGWQKCVVFLFFFLSWFL